MLEVLKAAKKALEAIFFKVVMIIIIELISPLYMIVAYLIINKKKKKKIKRCSYGYLQAADIGKSL